MTDDAPAGRETAPQSPFTTRDVATGTVVLLVGLAITLGLPLVVGV